MVFAAEPWHYWIAFPLAFGGLAAVAASVFGYLRKVQSVKYPKR